MPVARSCRVTADCDRRSRGPSARSEFGWRRPYPWCRWQRRRSLQKHRSRSVRSSDGGPSAPTRGTHRRTTHPLAAQSDHPAPRAALSKSAPLRIAAQSRAAVVALAPALRPALDSVPPHASAQDAHRAISDAAVTNLLSIGNMGVERKAVPAQPGRPRPRPPARTWSAASVHSAVRARQ